MKGDKAAAAAKSSQEGKSCRETKGDKATAAANTNPEGKSGRQTSWKTRRQRQKGNHRQGNSGSQEQTRREIGKGEPLGDKATAAAKSSPEGKSLRETSWETKQEQKGNQEGRTAGRQNHEGRQAGRQSNTAAKSPEGKS